MKELENVKNLLYNNDYKIIVIKNGEVIFTSFERGIKPIFDLQKEIEHKAIKDSYVADRVIGKAAAFILSNLEIKGIYSELISEDALEIFSKNNIEVAYTKRVGKILNRAKSDLCPIEKIAYHENDIVKLLKNIEKFLNEL
jgi:hypothetical protein